MPDDTLYKVSQGYEVLLPKPGKAYPILCEEWTYLKSKIDKLSYELNMYMECGFVLIGVTLSTFVGIITGAVSPSTSSTPSPGATNVVIVAWAIVAVSLISGVLSIFFAFEKEKIKKMRTSDIVSQMEIIEKRYQSTEPSN